MIEQPRFKILYMEDDRGLARLTERILRRAGYAIEVAPNGKAGLELYNQKYFDLILVDYLMPGLTGLEVIKIITEWDDPPPVVMVTGGGSEKIAVEAMKLGASDYLVKDIDSGYLELVPLVIERVMHRYKLLQEKKEAEEARKQLIQELDAFAHTVAHDLKNPLYSIRLNLEQFNAIGKTPQEIRQQLDMLDVGLTKMGNIIDELLLLSSVRKEEITLEPLDMKKIITESLHRLNHLIKKENPQFEIADSFPTALGHPTWIEEVWTNYISNAIKYGGNPPKISIGYDFQEGDTVRFWIKDNGNGLTELQKKSLFIPFTRLDTIHAEGHGLGLSIVERIIRKVNGETHVESEPGKGSIFSFTLQMEAEKVS